MTAARTVVVGLSGGVDSALTAALLLEQGHRVLAVTMQNHNMNRALEERKGVCSMTGSIADAQGVAETLGIPHHVVDARGRFLEVVMGDFAKAYGRGETPNPCVVCNRHVKIAGLLDVADSLGASHVATGHYVRRVDGPEGPELRRGGDSQRDQSYFLGQLTRDQLARMMFPLGDRSKAATRSEAAERGLPVADKPSSQDICFVPDRNYRAVVERLRPGSVRPGPIRHVDGRVLGQHDGIVSFTVGQRRGLALGGGPPLYVVALEPSTDTVVVGPRDALACPGVRLRHVNWLLPEPPDNDRAVTVKLRSAQTPAPAVVRATAEGAAVALESPAEGVAPGQTCVMYDGDRVLGAGIITRTDAAVAA